MADTGEVDSAKLADEIEENIRSMDANYQSYEIATLRCSRAEALLIVRVLRRDAALH